jgi:hypothetical protein
MVLCCRNCAVRNYGIESGIKVERTMKNVLTDFAIGLIIGFVTAAAIACVIFGTLHFRNRDKELIEYAEKQIEIELLREDYGNRDAVNFLDDIPDVRRAADGAAGDFIRKRDEALERFRSGLTGR